MNDDVRSDQRLPKKEIIRRGEGFRAVFQEGKCWRGRCLQVFFLPSKKREVGFAVPKRLGKAVQRNRVKRLMREVYRRCRHEIGPLRIVLLAKERARDVGFEEMEAEFEQFLRDVKAE